MWMGLGYRTASTKVQIELNMDMELIGLLILTTLHAWPLHAIPH